MATSGLHFHQAVARLAFHFGLRQFGLGFLHIVLHFLGLLHQAAQSGFTKHGGSPKSVGKIMFQYNKIRFC